MRLRGGGDRRRAAVAFLRHFLRRGIDVARRIRFDTLEPTPSGGYQVQSDGRDGVGATTMIDIQADHVICVRHDAATGREHHRFIDARRHELAMVHRFFASRIYRSRVLRALVRKPIICRMIDACLPRELHTCAVQFVGDDDDRAINVVGYKRVEGERDPIVYTTRIAMAEDGQQLSIKTWRAFEELATLENDHCDHHHVYAHAHIPVSQTDMTRLHRYIRTCCT
jgi:hypothetical protein